LYVAASRVRPFDGFRFYISEYNGQGHLENDERVTKNIVYSGFESLIKLSKYVCKVQWRIFMIAWFFFH
jgi:hypothetical protein